jgi:H+/Cl- antiporter ClcA
MVLVMPVAGLAIAGLAIAFAEGTGKSSSEVLFSGQSALGPLVTNSAAYTVGALVLLIVCKAVAYGISLSGFRGGPVFPSMFIGAVGGIALSHLPGLQLVAGVAMGIGAMCAVMLRLPLTSVLLATLLLAADGLTVMPLAIVAVVVAYVVSARLTPTPAPAPGPAPETPRPAEDAVQPSR